MAKTPATPPANPPSPQQGGAYRINANGDLEPLSATTAPAAGDAATETEPAADQANEE